MNKGGEQYIPGFSSKRLEDEHIQRYLFILEKCKGKKVLDIACGTGYGSYMLSKEAEEVVGVDISRESIQWSNKNYINKNLKFLLNDCSKIIFNKKYFDVIVSFETIEHLHELNRKKFYKNCINYLKDDGILIFSTPNKKITSPYTKKPLNKFHVIEFTKKTLENELSEYFTIEKWYGQRFILSFLTFKYIRKFTRLLEIITKKNFGIYGTLTSSNVYKWSDKLFIQPRIFIIIMKKKNEFFTWV